MFDFLKRNKAKEEDVIPSDFVDDDNFVSIGKIDNETKKSMEEIKNTTDTINSLIKKLIKMNERAFKLKKDLWEFIYDEYGIFPNKRYAIDNETGEFKVKKSDIKNYQEYKTLKDKLKSDKKIDIKRIEIQNKIMDAIDAIEDLKQQSPDYISPELKNNLEKIKQKLEVGFLMGDENDR